MVVAAHPWDDRAVVEANHELRAHAYLAAHALDDPHDVGRRAARRHEVEHADGALLGLPGRLEPQRVLQVPARRRAAATRRDEPPALSPLAAQSLQPAPR